jgi:hypothetical protein
VAAETPAHPPLLSVAWPAAGSADACTPGAVGCPWQSGQVVTLLQDDLGDATTAAGALLSARFTSLYGAQGYVEVGTPGSGGFSVLFTSSGAVFTYLPGSGQPGPLTADLVDPTSTAAGIFAGAVLALRLNVDLADAGYLLGTTGVRIGDLVLCGVSPGGIDGMTVRAFLALANGALGGGPSLFGIGDLSALAGNINGAFFDGTVTRSRASTSSTQRRAHAGGTAG